MENRSDISENFIPYELALKLKELGFDEECFGVYINGNFEPRYRSKNSKFNPNGKLDKRDLEFCTAPLWGQAFDWFREKHGLYLWIHCWKGDFGFGDGSGEIHKCHFKTYQEARQACLEKLIELCK